MKVLNEFKTHHYVDDYEKTELFCPNCGKQEVWKNQSEGDYYDGPDFICSACGNDFTMHGPDRMTEKNELKKLLQLRNGVTFEPSTPRGN